MGLWGSLVTFQVWDLTTAVQIRVFPFIPRFWEKKSWAFKSPKTNARTFLY